MEQEVIINVAKSRMKRARIIFPASFYHGKSIEATYNCYFGREYRFRKTFCQILKSRKLELMVPERGDPHLNLNRRFAVISEILIS